MINWLITHFRDIPCSNHGYYNMKTKFIKSILVPKGLLLLVHGKPQCYVSYISNSIIIIFLSLVIVYIQVVGSDMDINNDVSFMLPTIITLRKNKNRNIHWENKLYTFDNIVIFNKEVLKKYINKFWKENVDILDNESHIILLSRIRRDNGEYATIGNLLRLNKADKDYLFETLIDIIDLKTGGS